MYAFRRAAKMMLERIAICGGGNGALAAAGDMALRGFTVFLALRNRERFGELFRTRKIRLEGAIEGEKKLELVTQEPQEAVRNAQLIIVPLPAIAQVEMVTRIAPALDQGQVLYLTKSTLASPLIHHNLKELGAAEVPIVESPILPWGVRVTGQASARVALVAERLPTSVFPGTARWAREIVSEAIPATIEATDALDVALLNFDPALHAPLVVMNTGSIEKSTSFDVNSEGASPSVVDVSLALDAERLALRRSLGYTGYPWPLSDLYSGRGPTYYGLLNPERMRHRWKFREKIDYSHRYVTEDIDCGLSLWGSLGRRIGVETPLADAFLRIAGAARSDTRGRSDWTLEHLKVPNVAAARLPEWFRVGR